TVDASFNLTTGQASFPSAGITEQLVGIENLTGNWGKNTITNDVLDGGTGGDTYRFGWGAGQDVVFNSNDVGTTDCIVFDETVTAGELWFHQIGNDLQVTIVGSGDNVLIDDWFLGTSKQVDRFETADGHYLEASQVEQLRSAMAAFDPPVGEGASLSQETEEAVLPVIASTWQEQPSA
ncbi:MAG: hypothetical protein MI920_38615, partial [Kiloniellales bacterium]|nr:hypothetical protein [Kiloniellales bacterium]